MAIHGFGPNNGNQIRFVCNPLYGLEQPMKLGRPDGDYSPVERAVRRALGT